MSTWVDTFSLFWGLLSRADQERLQQMYGFDSLKYTRWTFLALGLTGFLNLIASIASFYGGIANISDGLWAAVSVYLLAESYQRREKWKSGFVSGSILGILFRPLASPLFK
jgi:hypothetical protein